MEMRKIDLTHKDMSKLPVIEVGYGLASAYDDGIEINRKLTGELRERILKHERSHGIGRYNKKDFKTDFQAKNSNFFKSALFAMYNPEALIGFFPFMYSYHYKIMTFNWSSLVPFLFFGGIFSIFFWALFKINMLKSFFSFGVILVLINIGLLLYTHIKVKKEKRISKIL